MQVVKTKIDGVLIIEPEVQDNLSKSGKGVLRGLHMQKDPYRQGKLVQVITGSVLDVAVDARPNSPTYGQWESVILSAKNKKQFWVPAGFLHGFVSLEDNTIFNYKCTNLYNPESEVCVSWDDKDLAVNWQLGKYNINQPNISEKDQKGIEFSNFKNII